MVDENGALLFFKIWFLPLLVRLNIFIIICQDGEVGERLPSLQDYDEKHTKKCNTTVRDTWGKERAVLNWYWRHAALT